MILGIPTLNRYDLLDKLIVSAEHGTIRPRMYVIVDNGGGYTGESTGIAPGRLQIIKPGKNLGVAASWNLLLETASSDLLAGDERMVISNDDIEFLPYTLEKFVEAFVEGHQFVGACGGWALFSQTLEVTTLIGPYDENFGMAYYEDCDYLLRLRAAGIPVHDLGYNATHVGNASTHGGTPEQQAAVAHSRDRNYAYFIAKWGADSPRWGNPHVKNYDKPFDGKSPPGWNEKINMRDVVAPMRWDVLNYIAKMIDAKRYLEIGVADGMKQIDIAEKWGVDPNPHVDTLQASTIFVPRTSDFFFEKIAPTAGLFDLVFIDGDHRAEQVYREVQAAMKILSPSGVICLHDCNPHTEEMQEVPHRTGRAWTGDVWKAIVRLRNEGEYWVRVIPSDFGIGIVLPARNRLIAKPILPSSWDRLLWQDLVASREHLLGLLEPGTWKDYLKNALNGEHPDGTSTAD